MNLTYYKNLDGVRAIAALMVMVFHFFQDIQPTTKLVGFLSKISIFGQTGVTLFFVLSGFLITRILLATKNTEGFFRNFYLRRTLRIFPLYYLFLVISYYFIPFITNAETPPFSQQIYYYTYLQNFATTFDWNAIGPKHFWSLAVEEHFYLFWPLVVYFASPKNLSKIILAIVIGAMALRAYMFSEGFEVFYFTFTRFDALAIGAYLAILELNKTFTTKNSSKFGISLALLFIPTIIMWTFFTGEGNNYIQVFKFFFLAGIYFLAIGLLLSLKENNLINKTLKTRFFLYTGKISYGLYVYHPLCYMMSGKYFDTNNIITDFIVSVVLTYIVAALSFHLFESSFLKLKKFFEYNKVEKIK